MLLFELRPAGWRSGVEVVLTASSSPLGGVAKGLVDEGYRVMLVGSFHSTEFRLASAALYNVQIASSAYLSLALCYERIGTEDRSLT